MRNILAHRYEILEDEKVFHILENNLDDFEEFKREVLKIIKILKARLVFFLNYLL